MAARLLKTIGTNGTFNYTASGNERLVIAYSAGGQGGNVAVTKSGDSLAYVSRGGQGEANVFMASGDAVTITVDTTATAVVSSVDA